MTTLTTRLALIKPTTADHFSTADLAANWDKIDQYAGVFKCTSFTRPVWGANQAGLTIYETDTDLEWRWTGSQWARRGPKGWLAGSQRTSTLSITGTFPTVIAQTSVQVPGGRTIDIKVLWQDLFNSSSTQHTLAAFSVYRDNTPIHTWDVTVWPNTDPVSFLAGSAGGLTVTDHPAAGNYTYAFKMATLSSSSIQMSSSSVQPSAIDVYEV
jgi:hypothetical protein